MGQRLIISEEERSRISGMYGLVNEQSYEDIPYSIHEDAKFDNYSKEQFENCGFEKIDDRKYIRKAGSTVEYIVVAEIFPVGNGHTLYDGQNKEKLYSLPADACWIEFKKYIRQCKSVMGYKVGPISGTDHFIGITLNVGKSSKDIADRKIIMKSGLRQAQSISRIEFNYANSDNPQSSGFANPAIYNCVTKKLSLPYDAKGGKDAAEYDVKNNANVERIIDNFCYSTKK